MSSPLCLLDMLKHLVVKWWQQQELLSVPKVHLETE